MSNLFRRDKREDKEADYAIYRIVNKVTYIVVEVKLAVGARLTSSDKDKLAQLFLEAIYVHETENKPEMKTMPW